MAEYMKPLDKKWRFMLYNRLKLLLNTESVNIAPMKERNFS